MIVQMFLINLLDCGLVKTYWFINYFPSLKGLEDCAKSYGKGD